MRLLGTWTAVFVLAAIVTAVGCGSSNMKPETGAEMMDDKMTSDGKMMSDGKMATDGNMMGGEMSGDDKMKSEKMMSDDNELSGETK